MILENDNEHVNLEIGSKLKEKLRIANAKISESTRKRDLKAASKTKAKSAAKKWLLYF